MRKDNTGSGGAVVAFGLPNSRAPPPAKVHRPSQGKQKPGRRVATSARRVTDQSPQVS